MGISGQDGALLRARKLEGAHDLGFVGEIIAVDPTPLRVLIDAEYVSIVARSPSATTRRRSTTSMPTPRPARSRRRSQPTRTWRSPRAGLRRNADPARHGARTAAEIAGLIRSGAISGGMIPKVEAALIAIEGGARRAFIGGGVAERRCQGARGDATEVFA